MREGGLTRRVAARGSESPAGQERERASKSGGEVGDGGGADWDGELRGAEGRTRAMFHFRVEPEKGPESEAARLGGGPTQRRRRERSPALPFNEIQ